LSSENPLVISIDTWHEASLGQEFLDLCTLPQWDMISYKK